MMQQSHTTLSNGLQSFADVSPDYELAPIGIGSIRDQAEKLAEYGRNGDIYIVHAAEGETVVPMEVLEANPKVKELLFGQMRDMGMDPQEFVVGSELNSINPTTGMPEFFFKKIFRSVKKAVKKVVGFAKKAAPIVLPIALSAFGVPFLGPAFAAGTFGAGFVGGGLGALAGGKSLKDSLKSGLISGGISSLMSGITGGLTSDQGFGQGFQRGLQRSVAYSPEKGFDFSLEGFAPDVASPEDQWGSFKDMLGGKEGAAKRFLTGTPEGYSPEISAVSEASPTNNFDVRRGDLMNLDKRARHVSTVKPVATPRVPKDPALGEISALEGLTAEDLALHRGTPKGLFGTETGGKIQEFILPSTPTSKEVLAAANVSLNQYPLQRGATVAGRDAIKKAALEAAERWGPSTLRKWAVPAGAALVAGAAFKDELFGVEDPEEITEDMLTGYGQETGVERYQRAMAEDPGKYQIRKFWRDAQGLPQDNPFYTSIPPIVEAAAGGLASFPDFPRRTGAIRGPGTERSDDIPAMLSDGEFVMTGRAVRGAAPNPTGNPELDRRNGAKNMYAMMRNFEMRA